MGEITSPSNDRIKRLVRLRDRRHRDREGVFVVEGARLVQRALAAGLTPGEVYYEGNLPIPLPETAEAFLCSTEALDRASYRSSADQVMAVFDQFEPRLPGLAASTSLVLAAESMEKPGNLGALLRTADAVGADAVIAIGPGVDLFNPNTIRASTGAVFSVPAAVMSLPVAVDWLRARNLAIVAAVPEGGIAYWKADLNAPVALMVGAEDVGLSPEALESAHVKVTIPMRGTVDSLNTSVAMALLAYETLRQREGPT